MIESIQLLNTLLNEKEEEYTRKKLGTFCTLLKDSKLCEEVDLEILDYNHYMLIQ
jgi:hypothetical protein